jgi:hypothetical protein
MMNERSRQLAEDASGLLLDDPFVIYDMFYGSAT